MPPYWDCGLSLSISDVKPSKEAVELVGHCDVGVEGGRGALVVGQSSDALPHSSGVCVVEAVLYPLSVRVFGCFNAFLQVVSGNTVCCAVTRFKGIVACF